MMHIRENYFIEKDEKTYILKKCKTTDLGQTAHDELGAYDSIKEAKDAAIKEMIREEVNRRKSAPLHEIIALMRQKYREFSRENQFFYKVTWGM